MSVTITVPSEYGPLRLKGSMKQPKAYADSNDFAAADPETKKTLYLFNCAQRAHGNYVENQPSTAIALLLAGLRYPRLSALLGVGWMIGRVVFTLGYCRRDKENGSGRMLGFVLQFPFQLSLWGLAAWTGISILP
ncbi:hypothetical protein PRZ48_005823 [Zasmidium cellare]|uniref:Uncharacterized protein n=1 Tax=Zasmidium cellare TaxID=395010 RepID=A0ABR0EMG2_ZASCE|nr:hypothetical protein PRZ48_005823 [Zasmidium cellare]